MRKIILALLITCSFASVSNAGTPDEGMWLPMFIERLNYVDMEEMGLQLTPEEIYSINNSSLKDAIVGLSGGGVGGFYCTAEVVSDKGLIFTNHHCGYNEIQELSTTEDNILKNGFWAYKHEEERPAKGMAASFLIRMADVTDSIMIHLSDTMNEAQRSSKIKEISGKLKKAADEEGKYNVVVKSFYGGNEYYMFVYQTYKDVRLVGTPPESIGKYGGDTDNWMWPRHTGDFSVFRIYSDSTGAPAGYSENNIPFKPKHHLPVSLDGVEEGEYAMVWGYPGGTSRYLSSFGIEYNMENLYPVIVDVFGSKLAIWKEYMSEDEKIDLDYASKYAGLANAWKLFIGMQRGIKKLDVYERKQQLEKKFTKWAAANPEREATYGEALKYVQEGYADMSKYFKPLIYTSVAGHGGAEIVGFSQQFNQLYGLMEDKKQRKQNKEAIKETADQLMKSTEEFYGTYIPAMDEKVFAKMMELYTKNVNTKYWPEFLIVAYNDMHGDMTAYADYVFNQSVFPNKERLLEFLADPKFDVLEKDPVMIINKGFMGELMKLGGEYQQSQPMKNKGDRLFIAGLREMYPDKNFYPDANSTMRFTYGTVEDYFPADAVHYDFVTTLEGVMEKEDPSNPEFIVDERLKELYEKKDYGRYGHDGELITCFLTTNDITGGNSGSPVMNGNGELIGIAFDGNWEAMSGDIAFETDLQRCINVDIRYVLFIIDKMAGAQNLIDELTIVQSKPCVKKDVKTKSLEIPAEVPAEE